MGRIYDYAKKLEADGVYTRREAEFFNPAKQDSGTAILEAGMSTEQVDDHIRMMMLDAKMRKSKKAEEFDIDAI